MKDMKRWLTLLLPVLALTSLGACQATGTTDGSDTADHAESSPYAKEGWEVEVIEDTGHLWALRPGEEKSEKHTTLIKAGPDDRTVKALDFATAVEYIADRDGFDVNVDAENRRIWVLRPGEEESEKHVTLIGAGPMGMSLKSLDMETIEAYMNAE